MQPASASIANPCYWWYQARSRLLRVALGPFVPRGATLLDVGSADGPSVAWLDGSARRIPLDIDPTGLRAGGLCASALALPLREASLDVVSAFDVVEHFPDDVALLTELHRVLRPGGRLLVSVPAYQWAWSSFDRAAGHYRRYTRRSLLRLLASTGFAVERATYAFAATFPFFAADRLRANLLGGDPENVEASSLPIGFQRLLERLCDVDRVLLRRWELPFGSSVFVAATRRG
ncbi:MAG: class I SAM-dependent methyltransferase [Actinomycetota bacterium]|nr:class I SAM-dependent methyltransferase [Actinomycetota bacterium]